MGTVIAFFAGLVVGTGAAVYRLASLDRWSLDGVRKMLLTNRQQTTHHGEFSFVTPPEWDWRETP